MKLKVVLIVTAVLTAVATPAAADAAPYLSAAEAARVAGRILHQEWNVDRGSGSFHCKRWRGRGDMRKCQTAYTVHGRCWWTDLVIRETWRGYRYRVTYDVRCH